MSLPNGWALATLDDVTLKPVQRKPDEDEAFTYIDIASVNRDLKSIEEPQQLTGDKAPSRARKIVENGDVLVSMTRPNLNAVAHVPAHLEGAIASTGFDVLRSDSVNSKWIFAAVRSLSFIDAMCEKVQGALYPAVKAADVRGFQLPIPPLAEQTRIAQKLDEVLAQVDTLKARVDALPAIIKRFRQSVLAAAVSGKLTEEWRGTDELINWESAVLEKFVSKPTYGSSAKSQKEGKVPVLRMGNLQDGKLDWSNLVYTSNPEEIDKYRLQTGDVLFNRTNSPELVGKTSIFRGEKEAIYAGYLIRIQCLSTLNPEFLNIVLNSPEAKKYCRMVKSDGVSQSNINAKKLVAYPLNCPPVEEQEQIVKRVEELFTYADNLKSQVTQAQTRINKLTQSILAKAFRGELVPQDPNDEPAEQLLARIRVQREADASANKPKKRTTRNRKAVV